jgi:DNA transformation protein
MAVSKSYRAFVEEQLAPLVPLRTRAMFGGVGLYAGDRFFALIDNDTLYFKVDDQNRPDFEAAGSALFDPYGDGRTMDYYAVPVEVQEDRDELRVWVEKAVAVAERARRPKRPSKKSSAE